MAYMGDRRGANRILVERLEEEGSVDWRIILKWNLKN